MQYRNYLFAQKRSSYRNKIIIGTLVSRSFGIEEVDNRHLEHAHTKERKREREKKRKGEEKKRERKQAGARKKNTYASIS